MNHSWLKNTLSIATLFSFRMLGLFMLIPVFTVYAPSLAHATPERIGFALGAYGLSQGLLQLPFGVLSDRYGRRTMITLGFILLAIGSLIGAWTHSIYGMILARLLQGSGAIGSVLIALLADLTPTQRRTQSMAIIGISIGVSFMLAMMISPLITAGRGLQPIFYFTLGLASMGLIILYSLVPSPTRIHSSHTSWHLLKQSFCDLQLQRLNLGIFCQHLILTSTFFALPLLLQQFIQAGHLHQTTFFYLPLMFFSFVIMMPLLSLAERRQSVKTLFLSAISLICVTQWGLLFHAARSWPLFCGLIFLYFIAFNLLEAQLPSFVSKQASPTAKGSAMGIYSSSQFLGLFVGGGSAGFLYQHFSYTGIFILNGSVALLWLWGSRTLKISAHTLPQHL